MRLDLNQLIRELDPKLLQVKTEISYDDLSLYGHDILAKDHKRALVLAIAGEIDRTIPVLEVPVNDALEFRLSVYALTQEDIKQLVQDAFELGFTQGINQ